MKYIIYLFAFCLFFGCDQVEQPKKPDNLISEEDMVNVLSDVFLINAAKGIKKRDLEQHGILPEKYLFDKYNIDSTQFALSNNYYAFKPETYKSIMERVKAKLDAEKKVYEALRAQEEKTELARRDSIRKVRDSNRKLKKFTPKKGSLNKN